MRMLLFLWYLQADKPLIHFNKAIVFKDYMKLSAAGKSYGPFSSSPHPVNPHLDSNEVKLNFLHNEICPSLLAFHSLVCICDRPMCQPL